MYKFKSAVDQDIVCLENKQLWVSTLEFMNDPMDLGFFIKGSKFSDSDIQFFQSAINKAFVIISLTKRVQNRRLWNYYTNGMKGFVLNYNVLDLEKSLTNLGAKHIRKNYVKYDTTKTEATNMCQAFLDRGTLPTPEDANILFKKDISWESENEYRIIAEADFLGSNVLTRPKGKALENILPTQIIIGYKMENSDVDRVMEVARINGIEVRRFTPNFRKKSSTDYRSELLYKPVTTTGTTFEAPSIMDITISDNEISDLLNDANDTE